MQRFECIGVRLHVHMQDINPTHVSPWVRANSAQFQSHGTLGISPTYVLDYGLWQTNIQDRQGSDGFRRSGMPWLILSKEVC